MNRSILLLVLGFATAAFADEKKQAVTLPVNAAEVGGMPESLRNEARAMVNRGMKWLVSQQKPAGYWSNEDFPALSALPLWALARGGCEDAAALKKAADYLRSCANPDGSICRVPKKEIKGGGLCNYNTALCIVALHALGAPDDLERIQKGRTFLAGTQHLGADEYRGGMGYDPATGRAYADLSNSYLAYEGMALTKNVEDLRKAGDKRADLDWQAAAEFVSRVQNLPGTNLPKGVAVKEDDKGGFIYRPGASMAGAETNAEGVITLRSYGSMTYAGLLSFIYAEVDKNDPRVKSAYEWSLKHFSAEQNPGMGAQGLFYYYQTMAKALAAYGEPTLAMPDGKSVNWRLALVRKLMDLQKHDAATGGSYWVNDEKRWWEDDPVLVTSYALLALEIALN
jgi:squalene-hopene/tetraprenyl-beta-curcumene cyclase